MLSGFKRQFFYSAPAFSLALLGLPLYVYMPTFYAKNTELGMFEVGITLFMARFLDVLFDPYIGYVSDRYSLRKSLVFFGAILLLIGFYFLTHPMQNVSYLWLFAFSIIVYFGWSMVSVAYYAVGSDISDSYHHNTHYASSRESLNILGVVTALLLPYIFGVSEDARASLVVLFNIIAISLPITILVFLLGLKTQPVQKSLLACFDTFVTIYSYAKEAKYLFSSFFLNNFANVIPATLFLLYLEYVLGAKEQTGPLLILYFLSGIIALPFWIYISKKFSKKRAWQLSMINATLFFMFVPLLEQGDVWLFTLITLFSGFSLGADIALPASMQADLAQRKSGTSQATATLFGIFAMITKLSLAFGVGLSFITLSFFDFDGPSPDVNALLTLSLLYGLAPVILKLFAIFVLNRYEENN